MLIYEGPNHSGTGNIAVIATGGGGRKSTNRWTGDMIQIWILPADTLPTEALKTGEDALVCGDCPLRPANGGGCYVNVGQAPNSIWRKYKRGGYDWWDEGNFNRSVRIGAYGDIAEIPIYVVGWILEASVLGHTCYTAQWRTRPDLQGIAMASVQTAADYRRANDLGWSTFRAVENAGSLLEPMEILCPAEKYDNAQCVKCKLCSGNSVGQRSIYKPAHGPTAKRVHAERK